MMRRPFWLTPVLGAAMVMAACGGAGAGAPAAQPSAAPGIDGGCPGSDQGAEGLPPSYRPVGNALEGDLRGDDRPSRATILGDEERPPRCRYFLGVEDPESTDSYAPIEAASSLPHDLPSLLMVVQIDGERGLEVVVDFGGPMHPHRSGQIFTFDEGSFVAMRTERPQFEEGRPGRGSPTISSGAAHAARDAAADGLKEVQQPRGGGERRWPEEGARHCS